MKCDACGRERPVEGEEGWSVEREDNQFTIDFSFSSIRCSDICRDKEVIKSLDGRNLVIE